SIWSIASRERRQSDPPARRPACLRRGARLGTVPQPQESGDGADRRGWRAGRALPVAQRRTVGRTRSRDTPGSRPRDGRRAAVSRAHGRYAGNRSGGGCRGQARDQRRALSGGTGTWHVEEVRPSVAKLRALRGVLVTEAFLQQYAPHPDRQETRGT